LFISGAALGAGMGLLFAPHQGRKMRRVIRHRASDARYRAEKLGSDISESAHRVRAMAGDTRRYFKRAARAFSH
jgi:gas vesicle protein